MISCNDQMSDVVAVQKLRTNRRKSKISSKHDLNADDVQNYDDRQKGDQTQVELSLLPSMMMGEPDLLIYQPTPGTGSNRLLTSVLGENETASSADGSESSLTPHHHHHHHNTHLLHPSHNNYGPHHHLYQIEEEAKTGVMMISGLSSSSTYQSPSYSSRLHHYPHSYPDDRRPENFQTNLGSNGYDEENDEDCLQRNFIHSNAATTVTRDDPDDGTTSGIRDPLLGPTYMTGTSRRRSQVLNDSLNDPLVMNGSYYTLGLGDSAQILARSQFRYNPSAAGSASSSEPSPAGGYTMNHHLSITLDDFNPHLHHPPLHHLDIPSSNSSSINTSGTSPIGPLADHRLNDPLLYQPYSHSCLHPHLVPQSSSSSSVQPNNNNQMRMNSQSSSSPSSYEQSLSSASYPYTTGDNSILNPNETTILPSHHQTSSSLSSHNNKNFLDPHNHLSMRKLERKKQKVPSRTTPVWGIRKTDQEWRDHHQIMNQYDTREQSGYSLQIIDFI